ncbi:MAG: DUF4126 domain-containing protein, partial [Vulcanimicrobiaceae bacterium]
HPSPQFAWLGSDGATIVLSALALLELASEKIPTVDHFMHAIHFAIKPLAAALLIGSTIPGGNQTATSLAMGLAALNAIGVHTASAGLRAASTSTTLGAANPFISIVEDFLAVIGIVLTFLAPFLAAGFAIAVTVTLIWLVRRLYLALKHQRVRA